MPVAVIVLPAREALVQPIDHDGPVVQMAPGDELALIVATLAPWDVVVLEPGAVLAAGALDVLADVAASRTDIASVAVSARLGQTVVVWPVESSCVLLTRRALTVVGLEVGESVLDFARRSMGHGFTHVIAGAVVAAGGAVARAIGDIDSPIRNDVPLASESASALASASGGIIVGIDAELIEPSLTGTFEAALAISLAVARQPGVSVVHWIASADRVDALHELLVDRAEGVVAVSTLDDLIRRGVAIDVAFRPYQDFLARTWPAISAYARRNIIWTLDLIANVTPGYARDDRDYHRLNRTSSVAWRNADAIGVLTPHVGSMLEAYQGGQSDPRIFVLPAGAPVGAADDPGAAFDHQSLSALDNRPFVLVLGNDYQHKGRAWFIRVMSSVVARGWDGAVVLAGPHLTFGGSAAAEARELARSAHISDSFVVVGRVTAADRSRLLARATLVVAPSVTEGWGMTPGEAIAHGSTPVASLGGGLRDITPVDAVFLCMNEDDADVATLERLLSDREARNAQRSAWARASATHTWDRAAGVLVEHMRKVLEGPRHFAIVVPEEDVARDVVRALRWRILDRVLPQGGRFRSFVARLVRGSA